MYPICFFSSRGFLRTLRSNLIWRKHGGNMDQPPGKSENNSIDIVLMDCFFLVIAMTTSYTIHSIGVSLRACLNLAHSFF